MRTFTGQLQGLSLVLASMVSCSSTQPSYVHDGPCDALPASHYVVPVDHSTGLNDPRVANRKLRVTVTLPANVSVPENGIRREPPYPVIFFLNGFLLKASYYSSYAHRLATWGYAVVQYDADRFPILTDKHELPFFDSLRSWLAQQSELHEVMDLSKIGVAGTEFVQAAFLVDPVDNTRETPESDSYPSAAKALKLHDRPVGMCGASVIGSCNPNGSNWQHFWPAVGRTSWLLTVNGASHNTFLHASWIVDKLLDVLCKRGTTSHQDTIALTMPVMVGWMDKELRKVTHQHAAVQADGSLQEELLAWIKTQIQLGHVEFETKGDDNGDRQFN